MLSFLKTLFGSRHERDIKELQPLINRINTFTADFKKTGDEELKNKTFYFRELLKNGKTLDDILPEAFAVAREAAERTVKMRPYDVQLMGAIVLHHGKISEMKTGEGKTLVAALALYLNALSGEGAHLVTVNDYLAKRDCDWMGPIYTFLGLKVDCIDRYRPHTPERREAYNADITYGTNHEFGFDYLRDNMVDHRELKVQRPPGYCIVDEVDSILIDEARTPLIISGPSEEDTGKYYAIDKMIPRLREAKKDEQGKEIPGTGDFVIDEKDRNIILTEDGVRKVEKFLAVENLYDNRNIDLVHHVNQALRAHKLFKKDVDYMVEEGQVVIIDEFTGRKMEGRRFSDGLHQALEAKERVNIESENQTLATITYQNYFRMYKKLAGMTGTADTEAMEFKKIYNLEVVVVPTNVACIRRDFADRIYRTEREKYTAILDEVKNCHQKGQPVLLGTVSVENSEKLSRLLDKNGIRHNVLNAKNHASEAQIIERAGHLGSVTIATNMAGRGTDIKLGPGVKEAGGLHVLGSERHESRRIDNQLRGRSGRQGDPGSSRFYLSLEDELMRLFGSERISNIMLRLGMEEGQEIEHALVNRAIENAQKKVESRNFDIRKHLLEYDDVMNQQRKYVYEERDFVLNQDSILDKIFEIIERVVEQQMDILSESRQKVSEQLYQGISTWMAGGLGVKYDLPLDKFLKLGFQQAADSVIEFLKKAYRRREENNASEIFRLVEKQVMLQIIDNRWKEHLLNMDHLREGISLRAYAERKPLTEYKHEGFRMFREMIQNLEAESLEILFRMVVTRRPDFSSPGAQGGTEIKNGGGALEEARSSAQHTPSSSPAAALKNKIGRNEICPCGSGKKFKHCCGRN